MALHTTSAIRVVGVISATGLVLASAGFGGVFAYRVGVQHSILLAGLTVLMALALEAVKPLAIAAAFQSIASLKIVRGVLLTLLGLVAVAYSLTSELSLISMTRGDMAAERKAEGDAAKDARSERQRIESELASIGYVRPSQAVRGELNAVLSNKKLNNCEGWLESLKLRTVCIEQVAPLRTELAKAERKEKLEAGLPTSGSAKIERQADPGSTALVTYLAALGIVVPAEIVAQWLNLVPVLALEIGSALAAVLVQAIGPGVVQPAKTGTTKTPAIRKAVEKRLAKEVKRRGEIPASERGLAALLGNVSKSTVRRSIHSLAAAGLIALEASHQGTVLRWVG